MECVGVTAGELARVLGSGTDHGGNAVEAFTDAVGGWPLRCCLRDSVPGDELATIALSPFPPSWEGPYRETGPVVVHVSGCPGHDGSFPAQFEGRAQVVRAFGTGRRAGATENATADADGAPRHTQLYGLHRLVGAGEGLEAVVEEVLADDRVEFVHVHNVISQCYSFTALATPPSGQDAGGALGGRVGGAVVGRGAWGEHGDDGDLALGQGR